MSSPAVITARWRDIAILSWPIDENRLLPFLPPGLSLDRWQGQAYVSLVCLRMENLRFLSLPALPPRFAEVNIRFYVRPADPRDDRIGVVFLKQMVSHPCVALAGRRLFREPMLAAAVSHESERTQQAEEPATLRLRYRWRTRGRHDGLRITARGRPYYAEPGSLEEFLTARHWGYTRQSGAERRAYRISRDPWPLAPVVDHELECDTAALCGYDLGNTLAGVPASVLLALGSHARVHWPAKLR